MQNIDASNRVAAVSGSFYPKDKTELSYQVDSLLQKAPKYSQEDTRAIIVPHAGYIFSAYTASHAYASLDKRYKNIFIIGSSHHVHLDAASIYNKGNYETPLGEVRVNQEIVTKLFETSSLFTYTAQAHIKEHTLEVQLPFLQRIYKQQLQIVPIIIATSDPKKILEISKALKPYFNEENLFIISTDLSHFPKYEDANKVDIKTLKAIESNNIETFVRTLSENELQSVNNLATSACGWTSVLTLLNLTTEKNYSYQILKYSNSGDIQGADKNRVVGYGALRVIQKEKVDESSFLSDAEKQQALEIAKKALHEATNKSEKIVLNTHYLFPKLQEPLGAFVTLYKDSSLRGCIGRFEPNQALGEVIVDMAIAAAQNDPRFNKVTTDELNNIKVEISVLTPRKKISSLQEIEIGTHGIYLQKGSKSGTYLPHVATQMGWNAQEFVQHCAAEKAGISLEELNTTDIYTYEAIVFGEKD